MKPPPEAELDVALVHQLLQSQFPTWATLELTHVDGGWNNEMYRLGRDLAVRVPRRLIGAQRVERQHRWLPLLAPRLPLPIPVPVGKGEPGFGYPWRWSVVPWFDGRPASVSSPEDPAAVTGLLTKFLRALWECDSSDGPVDDLRGTPLRLRDDHLRTTVELLRPALASARQLIGVWDDAIASRNGTASQSGCTVTYIRATSSSAKGHSSLLSTSSTWESATPRATSSLRGRSLGRRHGSCFGTSWKSMKRPGFGAVGGPSSSGPVRSPIRLHRHRYGASGVRRSLKQWQTRGSSCHGGSRE